MAGHAEGVAGSMPKSASMAEMSWPSVRTRSAQTALRSGRGWTEAHSIGNGRMRGGELEFELEFELSAPSRPCLTGAPSGPMSLPLTSSS